MKNKQYFYLLTTDKDYKTFEDLVKVKSGVKYIAFSLDKKDIKLKGLGLIGDKLVKLICKLSLC